MIARFEGEHYFLSNFYMSTFYIGKYKCQSVEHAYQAYKAFKCQDDETGYKILNAKTPAEAKRLGRKCKLPDDWEDTKVSIMITCLLYKFSQNRELCEKLLATGDQELIEGNWWGDTFWGVCGGEGDNTLGRALMAIRSTMSEMGIDAWIEWNMKENDR